MLDFFSCSFDHLNEFELDVILLTIGYAFRNFMNDIYDFDLNELFPDNRNNRNNGFDNIIISFITMIAFHR